MIIISGQTKDDRNGGLQGKNPVKTAMNIGPIQQHPSKHRLSMVEKIGRKLYTKNVSCLKNLQFLP